MLGAFAMVCLEHRGVGRELPSCMLEATRREQAAQISGLLWGMSSPVQLLCVPRAARWPHWQGAVGTTGLIQVVTDPSSQLQLLCPMLGLGSGHRTKSSKVFRMGSPGELEMHRVWWGHHGQAGPKNGRRNASGSRASGKGAFWGFFLGARAT